MYVYVCIYITSTYGDGGWTRDMRLLSLARARRKRTAGIRLLYACRYACYIPTPAIRLLHTCRRIAGIRLPHIYTYTPAIYLQLRGTREWEKLFHLIHWYKRPNTDAAAAGALLMQRAGGRSRCARRSSGASGRARTRGCRCSAAATCLGRLGAPRYFSTSKARKLSANSRLCSAAATCLGQLGATRHFCTGKASIFALVKLAY